MKLRRILGVCGFIAVLAALSQARTEGNSFLNKPASTPSDLVRQVETDPEVRGRYMRHFGMTKTEVVDMLSKLRLGRLATDGVFTVYNVPKWEEVRSKALLFKKGTLVWYDNDGRPVLKASCGNPMVRGTDIGQALVSTGVKIEPVTEPRALTPIYPETEFIKVETTAIAPAPLEARAAEVLPVNPAVQLVSPVSGFSAGIIPVVGGLLLLGGGGGTTTIPEPTSMIACGLGIAAMVARRRAKR